MPLAGAAAAQREHGTGEPLAALYSRVEAYYGAKVAAHGATPAGVDWTCAPTQELRFVQLLKLCDFTAPFSLNDVGCGYGALRAFLQKRHRRTRIDYLGIDISHAMVDMARRRWRDHADVQFVRGETAPRSADYSLASGLFNVKLQETDERWTQFIETTLDGMAATSCRGFAFNMKGLLAPGIATRPGLYRTAPQPWQEHCERRYGAKTEVISAYGLREFTILVRS